MTELAKECPECGDECVYQHRDDDGEVYWCGRGWPDPYPSSDGKPRDIALDYCPFCGYELEEHLEFSVNIPLVTEKDIPKPN